MATIKDVAQLSGVTVTTVSRVLNNRGYISEATRKKVHDAMKTLNYQPNELARSLFNRRSNLIGLVVPNVSHPFFAELTYFIEFYAYKYGYKILLCNSGEDIVKEKDYIDMLKRNQVAGIIVGGHTLAPSEYKILNLPIVAIDKIISEDIPFVSSDNYNGGVLATNLLIEKGCKKLAHISGLLNLNVPANNRCQAFIDVAKEKNISYIIKEAEFDIFETYEKLAYQLLYEHPDIDGVFASSDMIASAIISVANNLGKKIPEQLKIVGYDDVKASTLVVPPITTIHQPIDDMGDLCVRLLIEQIEEKKVSIENILPIKLIQRETT